jgi:hypothetical protein
MASINMPSIESAQEIDNGRIYVSRMMTRQGIIEWFVDDLTRADEDPCGFGLTVYQGPIEGVAAAVRKLSADLKLRAE